MISDIEQMFKNAGVTLDTRLLTEGVAELKRQYPLISDNDYQQLIRFDPTYKGGNELGKYGRWILDLYNLFVKDRNAEEKYEKAKAYVAEHPEAKMPPAPVLKSQDRVEDFQKIPELLKDLETHLKDVKEPIQSFKSVADLASAVNSAVEKDVSVDEKAKANYKVFREAMADGLKVVYQDNDWIIGIPETYEASSHFKKPVTNWCTAYPERYHSYMDEFGGKYYIHLNKKTGALYQLHAESDQFKNRSDAEIDRAKFITRYPKLKGFYGQIISPKLPDFWVLHNNLPNEGDLIKIIKQKPRIIKYIPNPSERLQIVAVSKDPSTLMFIENPTASARLRAVRTNGVALMFISKPTKQEARAALKDNGLVIKYIDEPTEQEQLLAVSENGEAVQYIKNPTEKVLFKVIENNPLDIEYIKNPSENLQMRAVEADADAIRFINNPTEKVQITAVRANEWAYSAITRPAEKVTKLYHELYG